MPESTQTPEQIKLAPDGNPFKSEAAAIRFIKDKSLDDDKYGTMKHKGGWAVATHRHILETEREQQASDKKPGKAAETKYFEVEFSGKAGPNDLNKVPLGVNGLIIFVSRETKVVLPEPFLLVAKDANHTQWEGSDDPAQPMKAAGIIHRFPFRILREATKDEYDTQLREGNKITHDEIDRLRVKHT